MLGQSKVWGRQKPRLVIGAALLTRGAEKGNTPGIPPSHSPGTLGDTFKLLPRNFPVYLVCFNATFTYISQDPQRSPMLLSARIFAEPMTGPAIATLPCLRSQERCRLSLGSCLEDVSMPHFQTRDQGETSRKENRFCRGECQRLTWRDLQVCPGLWESRTQNQLPTDGRVLLNNSLSFH